MKKLDIQVTEFNRDKKHLTIFDPDIIIELTPTMPVKMMDELVSLGNSYELLVEVHYCEDEKYFKFRNDYGVGFRVRSDVNEYSLGRYGMEAQRIIRSYMEEM